MCRPSEAMRLSNIAPLPTTKKPDRNTTRPDFFCTAGALQNIYFLLLNQKDLSSADLAA
jgi:hypothetical protein